LGLAVWRRILLGARDRPYAGWRSLVARIVAGLKDALVVGGLSAIGAALYSIGIPKGSIVTYESALKAGHYLVVAHGTSAEVAKAISILSTLKPTLVPDHVLEPAVQAAAR